MIMQTVRNVSRIRLNSRQGRHPTTPEPRSPSRPVPALEPIAPAYPRALRINRPPASGVNGSHLDLPHRPGMTESSYRQKNKGSPSLATGSKVREETPVHVARLLRFAVSLCG